MDDHSSRAWSKGLQHASDLLIRRGTAMGPLVPTLLLVPIFLLAAYLFRSNVWISVLLALIAVGVVVEYFRQFSRFAATDPDRLQSEHYRHEMRKIEVVAAKQLSSPVPLDSLNLAQAGANPLNPMPDLEVIGHLSPPEAEERL